MHIYKGRKATKVEGQKEQGGGDSEWVLNSKLALYQCFFTLPSVLVGKVFAISLHEFPASRMLLSRCSSAAVQGVFVLVRFAPVDGPANDEAPDAAAGCFWALLFLFGTGVVGLSVSTSAEAASWPPPAPLPPTPAPPLPPPAPRCCCCACCCWSSDVEMLVVVVEGLGCSTAGLMGRFAIIELFSFAPGYSQYKAEKSVHTPEWRATTTTATTFFFLLFSFLFFFYLFSFPLHYLFLSSLTLCSSFDVCFFKKYRKSGKKKAWVR